MEIIRRPRTRLREIDQECQARLARLEALIGEVAQLRAELVQAELEISEIWASDLPRQNKRLLDQVLRVRCRKLETTLQGLQAEAEATAPPIRRVAYRIPPW